MTCINMQRNVIPIQERIKKLKIELEYELNADFIDWKKYYDLKNQIMELEHIINLNQI